MRQIYLDYNATTPVAPSVQEAITPILQTHYGNPSSTHSLGRASHEAIEDARSRLALLLGANVDEIYFTGGGTEANNLAIKGVMQRQSPDSGAHLIISSFEHPATAEPAKYLESLGYDVSVVGCDSQGVVDPTAIESAFTPNTVLVSIMHANNEIGTVQPIRQISDVCRNQNVLLHTDAAQSVGKIRTNVAELGVDLLSVAGHKLYAPKGIGALYVREGVAVDPVIHGAGHERGLRPGTENTPYIVGLGKAAQMAHQGLSDAGDRLAMLRDRLLGRLRDGIGERLSVNGERAERLPNTLSANFPDVDGSSLLGRIPELCASTGSACHSGTTNLSATLQAIGITPDEGRGTVRLSVGWYTSEEDIDRAASLLLAAWEDLQ